MIPVWLKLLGVVVTGEALLDILANGEENKAMYNCHDDIVAYHNEKVTLPKKEQDEMRNRRNTNRDRLKNGLKDYGEPAPSSFCLFR